MVHKQPQDFVEYCLEGSSGSKSWLLANLGIRGLRDVMKLWLPFAAQAHEVEYSGSIRPFLPCVSLSVLWSQLH